MKRKRGIAKPKSKKKPSLVGENETVPKVVGLNDDHFLNGLLSEYDAMESETPEDEIRMNDHQAALEQVVANTVNSVCNMNTAFMGNLSKFASSTTTKSARGAGSYTERDSRMGTQRPRAETNMIGRQTDSEKGGASANGMMGFCPNALREMIISIMSDISKEPGGIANNPIRNPPIFHPHGERTRQEVAPTHNHQYKEQELNASLSVIKKIMKLDASEPFSVPVDPIALGIPDYFDVIDTPMDFGTICYNLENGYKYMDSEDVYKDVQHIWENCSKYNKAGDYILELMKRVKTTFMKYWTAAGLYTERDQATDGSTMMGSIKRKGYTFCNVPDEAGASHVKRNQPSSIFKRGYHPHRSSNEPNFPLEAAGVNISSSTGYSNLQHPTDPNMRHSMRMHDHPVVPVSDKTRSSQARLYKPSAIDNQPQLSSNQWHTDVNTNTAGYSQLKFPTESALRHNTRSPVDTMGPPVADSAGPSQVQFHGGSARDNHPQLSSDQPHEQVDLDTSGFSHSPPRGSSTRPNNHGKECQVTPENLIHQNNNVGSSKEQYYQSPLLYMPPSFPPQDDTNRDPASQQNKRNVRGPTRCLKLLTAVGRIPVSINELGQPIGDTSQLTSFLGLMARDGNLAPLTYPSWHKFPKENKEDMWEKVQSRFDIDPASKPWVLKSICNKWRNFKAILKTNHYDTHSTDAERLADRDPRVLPDQWSILVSQWNSEKFQEISAKNKAIRANLKFTHASGKKSYARIREEEKAKRPDGKEPSRAELFILTRTRKDGKPVNEETAAVISQLRDLTAQQPDTTENNKDEPQGDILDQVLGPDKNGRVRCLELGPSPTVVGLQNPSRSEAMKMVSEANAKVYEMNEKMVSMEQMCAQMAAQMSTMMSLMTSKNNSQNKHASRVVAELSDDSEELPQRLVHTSTSRSVVPPQQASGDSEELPQHSVHTSTSRRVVPPRQAKEKQARTRT